MSPRRRRAHAFVGVRPCDLHAVAIQDRVFVGDRYVEPDLADALLRRVGREPRAARLHAARARLLGYANGFEMARDHGEVVERAVQLKKAGNALIASSGGREIHPINVRVGGFYRAPARRAPGGG
jgi:hypothetical protein